MSMGKKVTVVCTWCGNSVEKEQREMTRSLKRGRFPYCNISCAAQHHNSFKKGREFIAVCQCGIKFKTTTNKKDKKYCSRECASKFSVNALRRERSREAGLANKNNLISVSETLKIREKYKYVLIAELLKENGIKHEFEFPLGSYVYDLVLPDEKILIEFDGPDHRGDKMKLQDQEKDSFALSKGFKVIRRSVPSGLVIDIFVLLGILQD